MKCKIIIEDSSNMIIFLNDGKMKYLPELKCHNKNTANAKILKYVKDLSGLTFEGYQLTKTTMANTIVYILKSADKQFERIQKDAIMLPLELLHTLSNHFTIEDSQIISEYL